MTSQSRNKKIEKKNKTIRTVIFIISVRAPKALVLILVWFGSNVVHFICISN